MAGYTISDTLQKLLKLHGGLTLSDLSRETQIPQPTLHHIVEGKTKKPRRHALEALANFFSISVAQLTGAIPFSPAIPDVIKSSLRISTVPLISWELAKIWKTADKKMADGEKVILDRDVDVNTFALQLNDDSMEPLFQEKSILIFDPTKLPNQRDFVLAYMPKMDTLIFNRLFVDRKTYYIKQDKLNGDAELIKLDTSSDQIIATLIEARMRF